MIIICQLVACFMHFSRLFYSSDFIHGSAQIGCLDRTDFDHTTASVSTPSIQIHKGLFTRKL